MSSQQKSNQQPKKATIQQQLSSKLNSTKVGESISGKDLAESIGNSYISMGVKKITRKDETTFDVDRTLLGKTVLNDSPITIKQTELNFNGKIVSAYKVKINFKNDARKAGALPEFYIYNNDILFYGKNGQLYYGSKN